MELQKYYPRVNFIRVPNFNVSRNFREKIISLYVCMLNIKTLVWIFPCFHIIYNFMISLHIFHRRLICIWICKRPNINDKKTEYARTIRLDIIITREIWIRRRNTFWQSGTFLNKIPSVKLLLSRASVRPNWYFYKTTCSVNDEIITRRFRNGNIKEVNFESFRRVSNPQGFSYVYSFGTPLHLKEKQACAGKCIISAWTWRNDGKTLTFCFLFLLKSNCIINDLDMFTRHY